MRQQFIVRDGTDLNHGYLVIKNLFDNSYIDEKKYKKLLNSEISLKKRKKKYLEDARYYVEDVRKYLVEKYGFDKVTGGAWESVRQSPRSTYSFFKEIFL